MKKYPIYALESLETYSKNTNEDLKNISNWTTWNNVKVKENRSSGLYAINFGIDTPTIDFPIFHFRKSSKANELVLNTVFVAPQLLTIEWKLFVRKKDGMLVNIIWLSGEFAANYYAIYSNALTNVLKEMNKKFNKYTNKNAINHIFTNNDFNSSLRLI